MKDFVQRLLPHPLRRSRKRHGADSPAPIELRTPEESRESDEPAVPRPRGRMPGVGHIERLDWAGGEHPLSVFGWLAAPEQQIGSYAVRVNGRRVAAVKPVPRRDVEAALPRLRGGRETGFRLSGAEVPRPPQGWSYVEVVALTGEGAAGALGTLYHPNALAAIPVPPPELAQRVHTPADPHFYRLATLRSFTALLRAIRRHAPGPGPSLRVLDWGAGCGGLTATLARLANFGEIHACDLDPATIGWAQEALGGEATFHRIAPDPPAPFDSDAFDIVVAPALVARLGREAQQRWLQEMRRILRPGGLLLASVQGTFAASTTFHPRAFADLLASGIDDPPAPAPPEEIAPKGFYRTTFQTRRYTEREWGKLFEILDYEERAIQNWQDLVVMRAPGAGAPKAVRLSSLLKNPLPQRGVGNTADQGPVGATERSPASPEEVVATHWGMMAQEPTAIFSWTDSPLVMRHVQRTISGNPDVSWIEYACRKYLIRDGRGVERGLSLGCGNGFLEREVRMLGACERMDAFDLAPGAIEEAEQAAAREGITGIRYAVADLNELELPENHYDVVFASMAVHHIRNLEKLYASVAKSLKPGGVFILLEFVGPSQFQFTEKALRIVNDLLDMLPPALRERASVPGEQINEVLRNPIEHMNAVDPSEAIRSAEILPLLEKSFTILEKTDYGGTLNHLLLHDIGQNFENGSPERAAMLKLLLYFEKLLIEKAVLDSDFTFVVARPSSAGDAAGDEPPALASENQSLLPRTPDMASAEPAATRPAGIGERRRLTSVPNELITLHGAGPLPAAGHIEFLAWEGGSSSFSISGWMVVPDCELSAVEVRIDGRAVGAAEILERGDVKAVLPRLAGARRSGFRLAGATVEGMPRQWSYIEVVGATREGPTGVIGTLYHPDAPAALPLPPAALSQRVVHATDPGFYRIGALRSFTAFLAAIREHTRDPEPSLRLLDWGAGCGRLTGAFARCASFGEVHACDIDPETTGWAREQFGSEARFRVIEPYPPTPFAAGTFDVVVAYSVMTHLDRDTQRQWLHEMRRVLRPDGLFLASVHGEFAARATLDPAAYAFLRKDGFHDGIRDAALDGIAPADYYRATYQTRRYTESTWGKVFDILDYRERGMNNWQDLVVMRAPAEGATATSATRRSP